MWYTAEIKTLQCTWMNTDRKSDPCISWQTLSSTNLKTINHCQILKHLLKCFERYLMSEFQCSPPPPPSAPHICRGMEMWCNTVYRKSTLCPVVKSHHPKAFTESSHYPFFFFNRKQNDSIMPSWEFKQKPVSVHLATCSFHKKDKKRQALLVTWGNAQTLLLSHIRTKNVTCS